MMRVESVILLLVSCFSNSCDKGELEIGKSEGSEILDLGWIQSGTVAWKMLPITNESKVPLTLFDVNTSCGCLASAFKPTTVSPGETYLLEVAVDTTKRASLGPLREGLRVFSTSEALNNTKFEVMALVKGPTLAPLQVDFGTLGEGDIGSSSELVSLDLMAFQGKPPGDGDQFSVYAIYSGDSVDLSAVWVESESAVEVFATSTDSVPKGFFEFDFRLYLRESDFGGAFVPGVVRGASAPVMWSTPASVSRDHLLRHEKVKVDLGWLADSGVSFPEKDGKAAGVEWSLGERSTSVSSELTLQIVGEMPGAVTSIDIPFLHDGRDEVFKLRVTGGIDE